MLAEAATRHDDHCPLIEIGRVPAGEPVRFVLSGDVDAAGARHLQQSLIDLLRRDPPGELTIDLGGITFLDDAGIEALLRCQADAGQVECRLSVVNPTPAAYRLLQIAGLLEQFGLARPRPGTDGPAPAGAALGLLNCGLGG